MNWIKRLFGSSPQKEMPAPEEPPLNVAQGSSVAATSAEEQRKAVAEQSFPPVKEIPLNPVSFLGQEREEVRKTFGKPSKSGDAFDSFMSRGLIFDYESGKATAVTATLLVGGVAYRGDLLGAKLGDTKSTCVTLWGDSRGQRDLGLDYYFVTWSFERYDVELEIWKADGDDKNFGHHGKDAVKHIKVALQKGTTPSTSKISQESIPPGSNLTPEDFGEMASSETWQLRQQIIAKSPLRKCCEIPASAPMEGSGSLDDIMQKVMGKTGASNATCERLVLYRLDGQSLNEAETYKHVVEFVGAKGKTDGQYLSLFMRFVSTGYEHGNEACRKTPVPILGLTIKLDGDKQEVIAKCEILATTEFMGPDADFMTRGSGFTEDGVPYRVYSYWKQ